MYELYKRNQGTACHEGSLISGCDEGNMSEHILSYGLLLVESYSPIFTCDYSADLISQMHLNGQTIKLMEVITSTSKVILNGVANLFCLL